MICSQCQTVNLEGFKFCRECGQGLQTAHSGADSEPVRRLIDEALLAMDRGDLEAAKGSLEGAVALDPSNAAAFSLLASAYERAGDIRQAIDALEKVVEASPGSTADRDKLAQLKGILGRTSSRGSPLRSGVLAGTAAGVMVCIAGLVLVFGGGRGEDVPETEIRPRSEGNSRQIGPTPPGALVGPTPTPRPADAPNQPGPPVTLLQPAVPAPQPARARDLRLGAHQRRSTLPLVLSRPPGPPAGSLQPARVAEVAPLQAGVAGAEGTQPTTGFPAPERTPSAATPPPSAASPEIAVAPTPGELPDRETGFIRVAPVRPDAGPSSPSAVPPVVLPRPGAQAPPPRIQIVLGSGGEESPLSVARRVEGSARLARQRGDRASAMRMYQDALARYQALSRRGGPEGAQAGAGFEACRRAIAELRLGM